MVDVYTKVWGPCLMLDTYFYNTYFGAPRGPEERGALWRLLRLLSGPGGIVLRNPRGGVALRRPLRLLRDPGGIILRLPLGGVALLALVLCLGAARLCKKGDPKTSLSGSSSSQLGHAEVDRSFGVENRRKSAFGFSNPLGRSKDGVRRSLFSASKAKADSIELVQSRESQRSMHVGAGADMSEAAQTQVSPFFSPTGPSSSASDI